MPIMERNALEINHENRERAYKFRKTIIKIITYTNRNCGAILLFNKFMKRVTVRILIKRRNLLLRFRRRRIRIQSFK